jgi:hypothetical protein
MAHLGIAGIHELLTATSTTGGTQFGNRMIAYNNPKNVANTFVAEFIRIIDSSGLANTVRGLEIQSGSGTTTAGVNTGIFASAKTFGLQGITSATAAGTLIPAGLYAENTSSTTGQALRVYTATTTTADLALFFQEGTQTFSGTGLKMNFGKGTGPFAGNFLNFQVNDVSVLVASSSGTIGIGTSTPLSLNGGVSSTHKGLHIQSGTMAAGIAASSSPMVLLDSDEAGAATRFFLTMRSAVSTTPVNQFVFNTNGTGYSRVAFSSGGADVAEWYSAKNDRKNLETGDLVSIDGSSISNLVMRSQGVAYDDRVIGIVSTNPGLIAGNGGIDAVHTDDVLVALAGRVPVKVSDEGGEIKPGDRLTSSSMPGVAMKANNSGMTIGIALEPFDGSAALSEGVVRVETQKEFKEETIKITKKITKDNRFYGGELNSEKSPGAIEEVLTEETVKTSTPADILPKNGPAPTASGSSGVSVKVGKVLVFVNLSYAKLDNAVSQLALGEPLGSGAGEGAPLSVDQQSGKVSSGFFGNVNMGGNNIIDVGKIVGMFGKWSLDENGKLVAEEIEAKRGTFKDSLNVGTQDKPTGITIYDTGTKKPYCLLMTNGAIVSAPGQCDNAASSQVISTPASPPPAPPAPAPVPVPPLAAETPASQAPAQDSSFIEPSPEPIPTPAPESAPLASNPAEPSTPPQPENPSPAPALETEPAPPDASPNN